MNIPYYLPYINGEFVDTKRKQGIINPANGEVIAEVSLAGKYEVELAIDAARKAFDQGPWKDFSLTQRKELVLKISQGILDKAGELARLETLNTGKPIKESTFMDIPSAAKTFQHFSDNLEKYLEPEIRQVTPEIQGNLIYQPQGVVVLIVPWNYPLIIASWKLAAALAAGNTVILKPSSLTPLTALELARIIDDCGLPKGVVNILSGSGNELGEILCADKRVDMISFTGSNEVGKQIIGYAQNNVKKLIMELGGKSASIVMEDADLELAVNGSLCSIFLNQGQMCTAMSRILVHEKVYDKFIADFLEKTKRIKLGVGSEHETQMGPLISAGQRQNVLQFVEKAKAQGAKLLCGGSIPEDDNLKNGFFFIPAVFSEITSEMGIFQEEVFGPVACIIKFSDKEEAVKLANLSDFGLAACIWSKDIVRAREIAGKICSGTVWINTYGMFYDQLPYGGFKQSGFGKELGKEGFLEYSKLKNVVVDNTIDSKPLVNYWYGL